MLRGAEGAGLCGAGAVQLAGGLGVDWMGGCCCCCCWGGTSGWFKPGNAAWQCCLCPLPAPCTRHSTARSPPPSLLLQGRQDAEVYAGAGGGGGGGEGGEEGVNTARFKPDKGFSGADYGKGGEGGAVQVRSFHPCAVGSACCLLA